MKKYYSCFVAVALMIFSISDSFASQGTSVGCALVNEGYLSQVSVFTPLEPVLLSTSPQPSLYNVYTHSNLDISLSNTVVVTPSLQKPFISSFEVVVETDGRKVLVRSSVRKSASEGMSAHLSLMRGNNLLVISCDSF
ncbi:hypothetical protein [uncultured Photobacterium sp.]|uniref:hypothetical protein n=1 Tax=uncultured Photobacterium sp. TaxID=173973 RepID=UPI002613270E|nr:hypothetical protein [uncultured Photobacterium sp.]